MTRGEQVKVTEEYDLFGLQIKNLTGIYIGKTSTGKHLVYFRENKEWAELPEEHLHRINPDDVPEKNLDFISFVRKLGE